MAQALELDGHLGIGPAGHDAASCEACARRARAADSWWGRTRTSAVRWFDRVNGTPVADIGRADLGSIRRLAEA
jgi:hypothetical protein